MPQDSLSNSVQSWVVAALIVVVGAFVIIYLSQHLTISSNPAESSAESNVQSGSITALGVSSDQWIEIILVVVGVVLVIIGLARRKDSNNNSEIIADSV